MGGLTYDQLKSLWVNNGGNPDAAGTMASIALAESGGDPSSRGPGSLGIWQIQSNDQSLLDPNQNARTAIAMSNNGQNLAPWCTAWADPNKNCGHGQLSEIQPGSAAYGFLNGGSGRAAGGTGSSTADPNCLVSFPGSGVPLFGDLLPDCLVTHSQIKALRAFAIIAGGSIAIGAGVLMLAAWGFAGTGIGAHSVRLARRHVPLLVKELPPQARQARADEDEYQRFKATEGSKSPERKRYESQRRKLNREPSDQRAARRRVAAQVAK